MGLLDKFLKRSPSKSATVKAKMITTQETVLDDVSRDRRSGYYFQNITEFLLYVKYHKEEDIVWLKGNNYVDAFNRGSLLFEEGRFQESLMELRNGLRFNPIGIDARFEMCEVYIKMHAFTEAKKTLFEMKDYLVEAKSIAQFYRRLGYIATEEEIYNCAIAAYFYSFKFEDHPTVKDEMIYIFSVSHMDPEEATLITKNAVSVLKKNGIPILTEMELK